MDRVDDPQTRELAGRVHLTEDAGMSVQLPDRRPSRVTIHLKDGRTLQAETETNRGDWADPYTPAEIEAKYRSLTSRLWTPAQASEAWTTIAALAEAPDLRALMRALEAPAG